MSMSTSGTASRSLIIGIRLCPPARSCASDPCRCKRLMASSTEPATSYSNRAGTCNTASFPTEPILGYFFRSPPLREPPARVPGPRGYYLSGYRYRRLFRRARPDVEPYRACDARELLVRNPLLLQACRPVVVGPPAAHRPDVPRRGLEGRFQDRDVELGVVGQNARDRPLVHLRRRQKLVRPGDNDLVGRREPLAGGEHRPRVADGHPVAHVLPDPGHRAREIYSSKDVHPGRRGERLYKDRYVLHTSLSARAEVNRIGAPTLEHTPRRLHDRPVEVFVARRSGMVLRGDKELATQSRTFDERGNRHRRLRG